jgi:hypothetical protein
VELFASLGNQICFWNEKWCGDVPLKAMFLVFFTCSSFSDASISSCLTSSGVGGGRVWNITFIQDFNDWEVEEVHAFFTFIHSKIPASAIRILCVGSSVSMGCLMPNFSIMPLMERMTLNSLRKPYGGLKLLDESRFLCGLRFGGRFSIVTI